MLVSKLPVVSTRCLLLRMLFINKQVANHHYGNKQYACNRPHNPTVLPIVCNETTAKEDGCCSYPIDYTNRFFNLVLSIFWRVAALRWENLQRFDRAFAMVGHAFLIIFVKDAMTKNMRNERGTNVGFYSHHLRRYCCKPSVVAHHCIVLGSNRGKRRNRCT